MQVHALDHLDSGRLCPERDGSPRNGHEATLLTQGCEPVGVAARGTALSGAGFVAAVSGRQRPCLFDTCIHAKIFGSETSVEVINELIKIVGVRRRQLQALFRTPGYDPLSASGMA